MKAKRKAFVARAARTPTVRKVRPAIAPAQPKGPGMPGVAGGGSRRGSQGAADAGLVKPGRTVDDAPATAGRVALDILGGRPVRLEVDLGRGLVLSNPIVVASGPFGYGVEVADLVDLPRLGGMMTRSTSLKPRGGHPGPRMVEVPGGLLLGIGAQNPGLDVVLDRYAPTWAQWPLPVIINLCGDSTGDLAEAARRLEGVPGVAGVEINLSCGSGGRGTAFGLDAGSAGSAVGAVRRACDLPLIAKLTAAAADVRAVARAVEEAGADAISAINTLPGLAVAADRRGPGLGAGYGGLCGPALKPVALRVVYEVAQVVDIPIVGIGGVVTIEDVLDMMAVGASAVGIGVAALADPMLPVRLADELADACRSLGLDSASELVGTALPRRSGPPSTRGAEYAR
jgi:dihydroorotate dehydrogenase (NAD+) catalytic subunit